PHQLAHLIELRRCGRLVFEPDYVFADSRRPDERCEVLRDAALFQILQIFGERGPFDVILDVALLLAQAPLHLIVKRPHRELAENLRSDALLELTERAGINDPGRFRVRQHVDESWRYGKTFGLDDRWRHRATQISDR